MLAALLAGLAIIALSTAARQPAMAATSRPIAKLSTMDSREIVAFMVGRKPVWERVIISLVHNLSQRVQPRWAGISQHDLRLAGIDPQRFSLTDLVATKVIGAMTGAILVICASAIFPGAILLLPALAFGGYIAPTLVVRKRKSERRAIVLSALPDFVGLLKAFVTAGVPLEQALNLISGQQAANVPANVLAREIRQALSDYGLGMTIDAALEAMAQRLGVQEVELFCAGLSQGKHQGAGMVRILRDQESVIRLQQKNRVTAEASRVSTRLVGILVMIYLPEFMLLIMVPLFYGIFLKAFS